MERNMQDMMLANCVRPPAESWIKVRDKDAANGAQEKKAPKMFAEP